MRYQAINNLYSNVSTQVNDKAYDDKGKLVEIDEDKVVEEVTSRLRCTPIPT